MGDLTPREAEWVREKIEWMLLGTMVVGVALMIIDQRAVAITIGAAFSFVVFESALTIMTWGNR